MKDFLEGLAKLIGGFVIMIATTIFAFVYGAIVQGLLFFCYYNWFAKPIFDWLPHLTLLAAIGLSLFLRVALGSGAAAANSELTKYYVDGKEVKKKTQWGIGLFIPWLVLLLGYIAHIIIG
jgi:hypothetical protein